MDDSIALPQLAAPHGDGLAFSANGVELTEDASEYVQAKLTHLEVSTQKLQFKNLELRLHLQRRKSRWAFERKLLVMAGLLLLLLGLVIGLFLGLSVGSATYIR